MILANCLGVTPISFRKCLSRVLSVTKSLSLTSLILMVPFVLRMRLVANFILYNKLRNALDYEFVKPEHNKEKDFRKFFLNHESNMSMFHTGYGIQSTPLNEAELKESWIEWFYQVTLINKDHLDTFHNKEYKIKIDCFVVGKNTFELIGSCTYDHKAGKITKYDKKLLLEVEN